MDFNIIGQSLRNHWLSHNVEVNGGVSGVTLESFEQKYGVILPADLRDYFRSVNGMPSGVCDEEFIRFWMLEEVKPLPEGALDYSNPRYVDSPESLFLFADYSIWAHAYAIRLTSDPLKTNEVIIIGGDSPIPLFESFSELVDNYLTNERLLLP